MGEDARARRELPALLDAHRARLASCRACGNDVAVLPIMSGGVNPCAMIVGQAPGITEASGGKPFAGQAGRTLFRWLARIGLAEQVAREHIYVAAVTRCYPGRDRSGRGDRVPDAVEQARCAPWLEEELRLIKPPLVIPIGRLAISRFVGPRPLDQIIGRVHEVEHAGGRSSVVPLPHPSGASSWVHLPANARLLDLALHHLRAHLAALGVPLDALDGRVAS